MLANKECVPCKGKMPALSVDEVKHLLAELPEWQLSKNGKYITRRWDFPDFSQSLAFISSVASLAEQQNHHPDIRFGWGYAELSFTTHAIGGLHENDLIMAAKVNQIAVG